MSSPDFHLAGVVGWPVAHSRSPLIHQYWMRQYGLTGDYRAVPAEPDAFERVIRGLIDEGYAGVNVTVPHKEAALLLADEADDLARRIGASNTLIFEGGRIRATNTDAYGFIANLKGGVPDFDIASGPALVLGAGGAARGVIVGLLDAGCPQIILANRTRERAERLVGNLDGTPHDAPITIIDWADKGPAMADAVLLVNTTSLGMTGHNALDLPYAHLHIGMVVTDIVYSPLETDLLKVAHQRGNFTVDGLGMLLHQAAPAFEAWFGVRPDVTPALRDLVIQDLGETS